MDSAVKIVYSIERARLPLSFCKIKFRGNLNCESIRPKIVTESNLKFIIFELTVVFMNTRDSPDNS